MRSKTTAVYVLCGAFLTFACSRELTEPATGVPNLNAAAQSEFTPALIRLGTQVGAPEREAVETIARVLALALAEPAMRRNVFESVSQSNVREGKLHLAPFLAGPGRSIVTRGLAQSGVSLSSFVNAVASVRALEFYMPLRSHREAWTGGEVWVAAAMTEKQSPIAFDGSGHRIVLEINKPPQMPVLVLTPAEAHFPVEVSGAALSSRALSRSASRTARPLAPPSSPRMSLASDGVVGMYVSYIRLQDVHEPWFRGQPELEMMVVGRSDTGPNNWREFQCSGEVADRYGEAQPGIRSRDYVYNQDHELFQGNPGVRLMSAEQLEYAKSFDPHGTLVTFWEDDDTACAIREKTTDETIQDIHTVAVAIVEWILVGYSPIGIGYKLLNSLFASSSLLPLIQGGDDYIGVATPKSLTPYANSFPENNHIIYKRDAYGTVYFAGRATIYLFQSPRTVALAGPDVTDSYSTSTFSSTVTGAAGGQRYTWSVLTNETGDPVVVQDGTSTSLQYTNTGASYRVILNVTDEHGYVGGASFNTWVNDCIPDPNGPPCPE